MGKLFGIVLAIIALLSAYPIVTHMFPQPVDISTHGGAPLFGATFFSITGLHLLHVIGGVGAITVVARGYAVGRLTPGHVETVGLYWHFVDLVWMFVVPLIYLLNRSR